MKGMAESFFVPKLWFENEKKLGGSGKRILVTLILSE
jgi:hypothetical protein